MEFKNTGVYNFKNALYGMRNPLNSWNRFDSTETTIGPNDLDLAQRLIKSGPEHMKFMRQIFVSVDITAPLYWWKEFDTYKVGTAANSTSTMHKLMAKDFTMSDFTFDETYDAGIDGLYQEVLDVCNFLRNRYLEEDKDETYWRALVQLLPNGYNQTRTWTANYAVLRTMYFQRRNHKLVEWHDFCDWIATLPYAKELIMLED